MSDETNDPKNNLRIVEFDKRKAPGGNAEANKIVADMFITLSERAKAGDIQDFVITFKSESRGIESMIGAGGGVRGFDFIGYIGMLEILKQRLLGIMSQMTYAYAYEEPKKTPTPEKPDDDGKDQTPKP